MEDFSFEEETPARSALQTRSLNLINATPNQQSNSCGRSAYRAPAAALPRPQETSAFQRQSAVTGVNTNRGISQPRASGFRAANARIVGCQVAGIDENSPPTAESGVPIVEGRSNKRSRKDPAKRDYVVAPTEVMRVLTVVFLKVVITADSASCVQHSHLLSFFEYWRRAIQKMGQVTAYGFAPLTHKEAIKNKNSYLKDVKAILKDDAQAVAAAHFSSTTSKLDHESEEAYEQRMKNAVGRFMTKFATHCLKGNFHNNLAWNIPFDEQTLSFKMDFHSFDDICAPAEFPAMQDIFPDIFSHDCPSENEICLRGINDSDSLFVPPAVVFSRRTTCNSMNYVSIYVKPLVFRNSKVTVCMKSREVAMIKLSYTDGDCIIYEDMSRNEKQTLKGIVSCLGPAFTCMDPAEAKFDTIIGDDVLRSGETLELLTNSKAHVSRRQFPSEGVHVLHLEITQPNHDADAAQYSDGGEVE